MQGQVKFYKGHQGQVQCQARDMASIKKGQKKLNQNYKLYNHIYRILKRVQVEQPDAVLDQRHLAAKICHQMAEHASAQNNYNAAINHYKVGALSIHFEYLSLPLCLVRLSKH